MGWCGYGIYSGDGTQTQHYDFFKWAKVKESEFNLGQKTTCTDEAKKKLIEHMEKVLSKMPKLGKFSHSKWNEYKAIDWQMLAALLIDLNIKVPKIVKNNAIEASEYLSLDHAADFDKPYLRRKALNSFILKLKKEV